MIKLSVKKNNQTIPIFNINNSNTKDLDIDLIKTTNVNILLNRVRLDKKKMFRKKIFFVTLLGILLGAIIIFTII
jgi:hypothetical protein